MWLATTTISIATTTTRSIPSGFSFRNHVFSKPQPALVCDAGKDASHPSLISASTPMKVEWAKELSGLQNPCNALSGLPALKPASRNHCIRVLYCVCEVNKTTERVSEGVRFVFDKATNCLLDTLMPWDREMNKNGADQSALLPQRGGRNGPIYLHAFMLLPGANLSITFGHCFRGTWWQSRMTHALPDGAF